MASVYEKSRHYLTDNLSKQVARSGTSERDDKHLQLQFLDASKIYNKAQENWVILSIGEFVARHGAFSSTNTKLLHKGNVAFVVEDRLSSVFKQKDGPNALKLAS